MSQTLSKTKFIKKNGDEIKVEKAKPLKAESPIYTTMNTKTSINKCIICSAMATKAGEEVPFCPRCIKEGFQINYNHNPDSVCKGIWQQVQGNWSFLPYKKARNPINKISANTSDMDNLLKFHCLPESKDPGDMWRKSERIGIKGARWSKGYKANKDNNVGIPAGKVNNIVVVDLDFQSIKEGGKKVGIDDKWHLNKDIHFHQTFGLPAGEDDDPSETVGYIKEWDTLTQKTANGGIHMFFKYDPEVPTSHKHPHIDIQSDGVYVVGAGSKVKDFHGNLTEYQIIHNATIKPLPEKLKEYALAHCYTTSDKERIKRRKEKVNNAEYDPVYYKYYMTDEDADQLSADLKTADPEYFSHTPKWCQYTTAMKVIGKKEIWDRYSKDDEKYDEEKNLAFWDWSKQGEWANILIKILKVAETVNENWKGFIHLIKLKSVYHKELEYNDILDTKHLGLAMTPDKDSDYIFHSSTGTGKTYLIKQLYLTNKSKFISITSRKSLAYEQYTTFNAHGIKDLIYYESYMDCSPDEFPQKKNVCIQLDSIGKLHHYIKDIGEYDIFLDEYSSLIEYLITSDTLKGRRIQVFKTLMFIIRRCRRVIGADADITNHTLSFLKYCGRKPIIINNKYEMATGRPAHEIFELPIFKDKLLTAETDGKKKFLLACDTKTNAKSIFHTWMKLEPLPLDADDCYEYNGIKYPKYDLLMGKDEHGVVVCLTSDNDGKVNLDDFDRVIFSPKIIYGLDSTMERAVFCMYEERTISPRGMLQQVARCRRPTELNFIFTRKKFSQPAYIDLTETSKDLLKVENMYDWEIMGIDTMDINLYKDMLRTILYNDDAYLTNPYLHFIQMVKVRGWDLKTTRGKTKMTGIMDMKKEYKALEVGELFDTEHPLIRERNEYIRAPGNLDDLEPIQKLVFTRAPDYENFLTFKYYCFKTEDTLNTKIDEQKDFTQSKMRQTRGQIILLRNLLEQTGCSGKFDIEVKNGVPENHKVLLMKAIINQMRMRFPTTRYDLSKIEDAQEIVFKCFKQVLGPKSIISKRKMIDGKRQQVYSINEEWKQLYYELASHSMCDAQKELKPLEDYDDKFGEEENQMIHKEGWLGGGDEDDDDEE